MSSADGTFGGVIFGAALADASTRLQNSMRGCTSALEELLANLDELIEEVDQ